MKINLKKTIPILTITILLISTIAFITIQPVSAAISITTVTPTDIPVGPAYTELTGPSIGESIAGDIKVGTIILTAPAGFEFDITSSVTATVSPGDLKLGPDPGASSQTVTPTTTTITIDVFSISTVASTITFSGIKIRDEDNVAGTTGDLTVSGTAEVSGSAGTLTSVPGALHHFTFTTPLLATAGIEVSIPVKACDQYENTIGTYTGTPTLTSTDTSATVKVAGTPTPVPTAVDAFVAGEQTLLVTFNTFGDQTLTLTDGVISSESDPITVGVLSSIVITAPSAVTKGASFTITVELYDQYGNLKTDYDGTVTLTSTDTLATVEGAPIPYEYTFNPVTDPGTHDFSVTFNTAGLHTITVSGDAISSESDPITVLVLAAISPSLIAGGETCWFDITVTNTVSEASIYKTEITYPAAWTFVDVSAPTGWVIDAHTAQTVTFRATGGYEIPPDGSAVFKFKMTTATPTPTTDYSWTIACTDTTETVYTPTVYVTVDVQEPTVVSVAAPTVDYYSVGAGNYIWLNLTVTDDIEAMPDVYMNATDQFKFLKVEHTTGTTTYTFCYVNKTAISDGPLAVWFNVTDYVGNWYEGTSESGFPTKLSAYVDKTVDNTVPFIWINVEEATLVDSTFYIGKDATSIDINVTVADYGLEPIGPLTGIYVNGTLQTGWMFSSTVKTYKGYPVWEHRETGFSTSLEDNLWILYVNITDTALPSNHTSWMEVYISRDLESPYEIGFTSAEAICGGVIIRGLYAKDLVGVKDYILYLNGTVTLATITEANLKSTLWTGNAFNRIAVLDLSAYAGDFVNITVIAEDFGLNPSDEIVLFTGVVPEGKWYAVELYKGWNLVSLPLIPNSTASADVLSLILKQGATGVRHTYEYDQYTDSWIVDPATIEDGKGYWFYMKDYDVLIVSGSEMPPGGGVPPTYTLTEGWVLAGFKSTADMTVADYLASVRNASYFKIIYIWDAADQSWGILNRDEAANKFTPGQGFWILMYEEEVLVPPTA